MTFCNLKKGIVNAGVHYGSHGHGTQQLPVVTPKLRWLPNTRWPTERQWLHGDYRDWLLKQMHKVNVVSNLNPNEQTSKNNSYSYSPQMLFHSSAFGNCMSYKDTNGTQEVHLVVSLQLSLTMQPSHRTCWLPLSQLWALDRVVQTLIFKITHSISSRPEYLCVVWFGVCHTYYSWCYHFYIHSTLVYIYLITYNSFDLEHTNILLMMTWYTCSFWVLSDLEMLFLLFQNKLWLMGSSDFLLLTQFLSLLLIEISSGWKLFMLFFKRTETISIRTRIKCLEPSFSHVWMCGFSWRTSKGSWHS